MAIDLKKLTTLQLLEEHNRIVDQDKALDAWDGEKDVLVTLVQGLKDAEAKRQPARTIKSAAYELLLQIEGEDHNHRPYGLPYDAILQRLRDEFPESETTDKCLRWYQVQLNGDGAKVPWRPRKPPKRKKKETKA